MTIATSNRIGLKRLYNQFNKEYFDNTLPSNAQVYYTSIEGSAVGYVFGVDGIWHIQLSSNLLLFKNYTKLILLHEMEHIHQFQIGNPEWYKHDYFFRKDLAYILQQGAIGYLC